MAWTEMTKGERTQTQRRREVHLTTATPNNSGVSKILFAMVAVATLGAIAIFAGASIPVILFAAVTALAAAGFGLHAMAGAELSLSLAAGKLRVTGNSRLGPAPVLIPTAEITQLFATRPLQSHRQESGPGDRTASLWACMSTGEDRCIAKGLSLRDAVLWETAIEQHLELQNIPLPGTYCRLTDRDIPVGRDAKPRARDTFDFRTEPVWEGAIIGPEL